MGSGRRILSVPVYARTNSSGIAPLWIVGFRWGVRDSFGPGQDEPLSHVWFVAISRRAPWRVLAQDYR